LGLVFLSPLGGLYLVELDSIRLRQPVARIMQSTIRRVIVLEARAFSAIGAKAGP